MLNALMPLRLSGIRPIGTKAKLREEP